MENPTPVDLPSSIETAWPALPLSEWEETYRTLHLWTQIAGKVRMALAPRLNHWWNVALYVTPCGLTTSAIPYGSGAFDIRFDFVNHQVVIGTNDARQHALQLNAEPVAVFFLKLMTALRSAGITLQINTRPQEIPNPIPFEQDYQHASYDREYAYRWWRILLSASVVLERFRSRFIGKCSPVHFFWGSFDLACTRFSGRVAPPRKGIITSEAYSHEVISAGFWPGGNGQDAAFYAYAAPSPAGLEQEAVGPPAAFWSKEMSEFFLPYEEVRKAPDPAAALTEFWESTYQAAARLAHWDRAALERPYSAAQPA